ncbi:MAG: hypothetical protein ACJA1N_001034, partial [Saprospiraceae bacterium]
FVKGEIRDFQRIGNRIFIAKNNNQLQVVGF